MADLDHDDYTVGWICALAIEMASAKAMLDNIHQPLARKPDDSNTYIFGDITTHNVVIACLPAGHYGTTNAAAVAGDMRRSFPSVDKWLMVGIGGGAPESADIRLGDIVVGTEVIQHDFGKALLNGIFSPTGLTMRPPNTLMTAVSKLQADHMTGPSKIPAILDRMVEQYPTMTDFKHPSLPDQLFHREYRHVGFNSHCEDCDDSYIIDRHQRDNKNPKVFYGKVASGNQVIKDGQTRARLANEHGSLCFEMEAAGLINHSSFLVIRGICDYSDSHKNKRWQEYSAAKAAAYAKELLSTIIPTKSKSGLSEDDKRKREEKEKRRIAIRRHLFESLRFEGLESRKSDIKAAHNTTCEWFLTHRDYLAWREAGRSNSNRKFLWIMGKPGAGKSTLMKYVYNHEKQAAPVDTAIISFFFNARGTELERTTVGMYRSLIFQVLRQFPNFQEGLDHFGYLAESHASRVIWDVITLQTLISLIAVRFSENQLICFVDALDECNPTEIQLVVQFFESMLDKASENDTKLRICFSSRHYPYIHIRNSAKVILEDEWEHETDMENYAKGKLEAANTPLGREIISEIIQKSTGVFLWVVLVVGILNEEIYQGRMFAIRQRLQELPEDLSALFRDTLKRDNENMEDLLLCVQWILYAKRPLRYDEFYFAIVSSLKPELQCLGPWDYQTISEENMKSFVSSSSKGLAEISASDNQSVQFIHESVKDFLIKHNGISDLWPQYANNFEGISHERLKTCCYTYIQVNMISVRFQEEIAIACRAGSSRIALHIFYRYPFLDYACRHVLNHADEAANVYQQSSFLAEFALRSWINLKKVQRICWADSDEAYTNSASLVYILADQDCGNLLPLALSMDGRVHLQGERYHYPMFAALKRGHKKALKGLFYQMHDLPERLFDQIGYGKEFTFRMGMTPLHWAADEGHLQLLKYFILSRELYIDSIDEEGYTPLAMATKSGHEAIVKILLASEAVDPDSKCKDGRTPLAIACWNGNYDIALQLIDTHRVNLNSKDRSGMTPLSHAALGNSWEVVKLLLSTPAIELNPREKEFGLTPLSIASSYNNEAVVKLLLETDGIDRNSRDFGLGISPLGIASFHGNESAVKLLLAASGVDPDSKDTRWGRTPLSWAAGNGHDAVVELLLTTAGVDPNSRDTEWGRTPLLWASINGRESVTEALLANKGVEPDPKDAVSLRSPLSYAAGYGDEKSVRILISHGGVDLNYKDHCGLTPLAWAARNGRVGVVQLLLGCPSIDIHCKDLYGKNPLMWRGNIGYNAC